MKSLTIQNYSLWLQKYPHWWAVRLLPEDCTIIENEARKRVRIGKERGWQSKTSGDPLPFTILGAAGEYASALIYNVRWNRIRDDISISELRGADLGDFIQVKSRRSIYPAEWDLIANDDPKNPIAEGKAYVSTLTCLYPNWIFVVGYAWGSTLLARGQEKRHSTSGHRIKILPIEKLEKPVLLFDEIRRRQGSAA